MGSDWIDISMALRNDMVVWPGNDAPDFRHVREFEDGFRSISSVFTSNLHNGTHVDAPLHFIPGGASVETVSLDSMIGPCDVVDLTDVDVVTSHDLEAAVPPDADRVLMRTKNSLRRSVGFDTEFVGLTADAAAWCAHRRLKLIGNDYPSIALYKGPSEIHTLLMQANVTILEGLVLDHVAPGRYELACLPLLIPGAEGSLARAVIRAA